MWTGRTLQCSSEVELKVRVELDDGTFLFFFFLVSGCVITADDFLAIHLFFWQLTQIVAVEKNYQEIM